MSAPAPTILVDTPTLRVTRQGRPGAGDMILCFSGVQHSMAGEGSEEFVRTLSNINTEVEILYISDLTRSWYNHTLGELLPILTACVGDRRVLTLGNSMGGFGAIAFGSMLSTCHTVIAFCPQFSARQDRAPFEDRWTEYRSLISTWPLPDCWALARPRLGRKVLVFSGADNERDGKHLERIVEDARARLTAFVIADCSHDVARRLRSSRALVPILDAVIATGSAAAVPGILDGAGLQYQERTSLAAA